MLLLVPSVTIFQYALCNWRMIKYQVTLHDHTLHLQQVAQGWTSGTLEDEKTTLRQILAISDFCLCLPSWYGFSQWNLYLAFHLRHVFKLKPIPVFIYETTPEEYLLEAETSPDVAQMVQQDTALPSDYLKKMRHQLIYQQRLTQHFAHLFRQSSSVDPKQEWGTWVPDPNEPNDPKSIVLDAIKPELIGTLVQYALVTEVQRLLKQKNYYGGLIDGDFGPRTQFAIRRFQRLNNLSDRDMQNTSTLYQLLIAS